MRIFPQGALATNERLDQQFSDILDNQMSILGLEGKSPEPPRPVAMKVIRYEEKKDGKRK